MLVRHLHLDCTSSQREVLYPPTKIDGTLCQKRLWNWETTAPASDFVESLEQTLTTLLLDGYPKINVAAEVSEMSVRTLQRQLARHHLTYSRLLNKVRYKLAITLLQEPNIKIIEVAHSLGFTDPANFSHAFRRWTGLSPRQFRKQGFCLYYEDRLFEMRHRPTQKS